MVAYLQQLLLSICSLDPAKEPSEGREGGREGREGGREGREGREGGREGGREDKNTPVSDPRQYGYCYYLQQQNIMCMHKYIYVLKTNRTHALNPYMQFLYQAKLVPKIRTFPSGLKLEQVDPPPPNSIPLPPSEGLMPTSLHMATLTLLHNSITCTSS